MGVSQQRFIAISRLPQNAFSNKGV